MQYNPDTRRVASPAPPAAPASGGIQTAAPFEAVGRALRYLPHLKGKLLTAGVLVIAAELVLPASVKPSHLIGSFNANLDVAEMQVKGPEQARYERELANARTAPPANWQMETQVSAAQQQVVAGSMGVQSFAADMSDLACFASMLMPNTGDWREYRATLQAGCGVGDAVRANMAETLARTARQGSGIAPRAAAPSAPVPVNQQTGLPTR